MAIIEMYTTVPCPYCVQIKDLFKKKGVNYTEHDIRKPGVFDELLRRGPSNRTVPQIFINGVNIGDDDAIMDLHKAGKLDALLNQPDSQGQRP